MKIAALLTTIVFLLSAGVLTYLGFQTTPASEVNQLEQLTEIVPPAEYCPENSAECITTYSLEASLTGDTLSIGEEHVQLRVTSSEEGESILLNDIPVEIVLNQSENEEALLTRILPQELASISERCVEVTLTYFRKLSKPEYTDKAQVTGDQHITIVECGFEPSLAYGMDLILLSELLESYK